MLIFEMLVLTKADTLVVQQALNSALGELYMTKANLIEALATRGVAYEPTHLSRNLKRAQRLKATTALHFIDAVLECARAQKRVLYVKRPEGLRFWTFQGSGAVFRPAHCTGNSVSWADMLRVVTTASQCSTLYYLRSSIAELARTGSVADPAERLRDIKIADVQSAERMNAFLREREVQLGA